MNNKKVLLYVLMAFGIVTVSYALGQDEKAPNKTKPAAKKAEPTDAKKEEPKSEKPKPDAKGEGHSAAGMEDWMKMAAPGEHHKKLNDLVGTWNLIIKYPEEGSGESKGTSEFKWIMDGRFLAETTRTDMQGMTFEWMGWLGYDNQKKQYVSAWVDNFGTGIVNLAGHYDDAKKTLTYSGEVDDPAHGGKQTVKWIMTLESKNKFTTKMIEGVGNGKEKVVMEITATRG